MIDLEKYDYRLPENLIRKQGVEPRDSAKLFIYDTKTDTVSHSTFRHLAEFLPERSVMVLNHTKVVPARLFLKKETGGKIEVFVLANEMNDRQNEIPVLVDRKCEVGWKLYFPNQEYFEVVRQEENKFFVVLRSEKKLEEMLSLYGETPIPHYLENERKDEKSLRERYQTIFANSGASVAAPTASLHFTEDVFGDLKKKKIERVELILNVGMGTFAPLKDEHFQSGKLHSETVFISNTVAEKINKAKKDGEKVIAVGTTVLRTLESAMGEGKVMPIEGSTDIFIYPPYHFQAADILITNFHLPKTSLMLLVDAFLEHKGAKRRIMDLYDIAIQEGYAFYSFGDSMLIL